MSHLVVNFCLRDPVGDCSRSTQPRSQGFSLFVIGKAGKGSGTGRSSMYSDWSMTSHYYANNAILH